MLNESVLSDAQAMHLAGIAEDCETWIGPEARLVGIRCETFETGVRLVARYRLGASERESDGVGDSMLTAHEALRARILLDRIRFGFSDYVEH